jgi:hypothetical protein
VYVIPSVGVPSFKRQPLKVKRKNHSTNAEESNKRVTKSLASINMSLGLEGMRGRWKLDEG